MNLIRHIRTSVFDVTQAEFAQLVGVMQSTVSRWENGVEPDRADLARIRDAAETRGIEWKDEWFFANPKSKDSREGAAA